MKSLISKVLNKIVFILIKLNIINPKSIFYMWGVNILPPTLSAEEEMELIKQLANSLHIMLVKVIKIFTVKILNAILIL